jgi:membrane-bound lytic murein transglycosylase D
MQQRKMGVLPQSLLVGCLCAVALTPGLAQGRGTSSTTSAEIPAEVQQRSQEIQRIIDRSDERMQAAEGHFNKGEYEQARRAYDRSIDIILESGVDVRSDARLQQYYKNLVDRIVQRQLALIARPSNTPASTSGDTAAQIAATNQTQTAVYRQERRADERGFGEQRYEASPLDELATLKLTEAEMRGATDAEARATVAAAGLDFNFRPNSLVQSFINYYQGRGRATMESGLRRSGRFMALARRIFKEEGVPQDLVWLSQVESAWSPSAKSYAAAVGLWQFIPGTGMRFGLRQDYWVDERSSFEQATRASAKYLKWLADRYAGNWELAMAAYNTGEGRVDSAIARTGYADFWELYYRGLLPMETRNYVPNILATVIIAKNPERWGFTAKAEPAITYDIVSVNNAVDLHLVADACDASYDYLLALNPELKRGITPPGLPYGLRVPVGKGKPLQVALSRIPSDKRTTWRMQPAMTDDTFATIAKRTGVSEQTLSAINGGTLTPGQKVIIPSNTGVRTVAAVNPKAAAPESTPASNGNARVVVYKVKPGESMGDIAARYGISVRDIAAYNRLSSTARLRAGQVVKVPVRGN